MVTAPPSVTYALLRRRRAQTSHHALLIVLLGVAVAGALGVSVMLGTAVAFYRDTAGQYPPLAQQLNIRGEGLTVVLDRDGEPLGTLTNPNSAIANPVPLNGISPYLVSATISTEDNGFWGHGGVDLGGIVRAAWSNYVTKDDSTGGSTITQQLVKTAYFTTDCEQVNGVTECSAPRTIDRKLKEMVLATEAEDQYSKEQILSWYLNSISYAGRYVGAEAAAEGYFNKPASALTLAEAAVLAGLPSAPTRYNPRTNCVPDDSGEACALDAQGRSMLAGEAKARQEHVLDLMAAHGHITREEAAAASAETVFVWPDINANRAAAFIDDQVEPRLVRMCEAGMLPRLQGAKDCVESVHTAGYKVTSTLSWALNQRATATLNEQLAAGLAAGCDCHNGSIVTIEPQSGQVLVYVPNLDPTWVSDPRVAGNIDQAVDIHQPGSSFKPAVYLSWMDALNKTPMSSIWDTNPINLIDKPKTPDEQVTIQNPGKGGSQGLISARAALGGSQNVPAFRAATETGVDNVISMAKALGITTLEQGFDPTFRYHPGVIYGPAIATGGANVRVIDMAYMDSTIANMGVMVGVPTLARTFDPKDAISVSTAEGDTLDKALAQRDAFSHGHIRLPGTRKLDPVVVLKVEAPDGTVLYEHGADLQKTPVVNAGSVWMVHSIMSDCTARFLIWTCGSSNNDLSLDFFMDGVKIPGGVKTGTQQGATAKDTLETWMTGYSRYGATAVWVGNANKQPVKDGPEGNYASANATVRLFKNWMGSYHSYLRDQGVFVTPAGFEELQPENVKFGAFQSATTERGQGGGCYTRVNGWYRTDIDYLGGDCKGKACVELPAFKRDLAVALAYSRGIPACGIASARPSPTAAPEATQPPSTPPPAAATPAQPPRTQPVGNGNGNDPKPGNGNGNDPKPGGGNGSEPKPKPGNGNGNGGH